MAHDIACSAPSSGARRRLLVEGDDPAVTERDLAVDGGDTATEEPGRRAESPLRHRQGTGSRGGEQRGDGQAPGLGHVGHEHREGAPGEGEPEVGVDEPSEELQVVRQDQEGAEHHEGDQDPTDPREPGDPERDRAGQAHRR